MFGSKKESEPPAPFNLKVLTAQHVIEGTAAGDERLMFGNSGTMVEVNLSSVTTTCIDLRQPVPRTCDRFVVNTEYAAVLVPDVDPARLRDWETYKCCSTPHKGTFYVGPYVVSGSLMVDARGYIQHILVGIDLHFSTLIEGPECAQFDAPFAVVSPRAVAGWEAE